MSLRPMWQLLTFTIIFFLQGCGLVQKVAVSTTADVLYEGSAEIETETDWELVRDALAANLKMMEGLLFLDPENEKLLAGLAKGYAGMGYAIDETQYLDEKFREISNGEHWKKAVYHYSKGVGYGLRFLNEYYITYEKLMKLMNKENGVFELFEEYMGEDDYELEGVFYTAQALGSLILLKQTDMTMVAQLPIVKSMFDWVCSKKPDINYGACDIFFATYEAARPRMLGGNPEKARRIFEGIFKKYPHNYMARTAFIRFYILPMEEEDLYNQHRKALADAKKGFEKFRVWAPGKNISKEFEKPRLRLFQTIAFKRMEYILKYEKDIFDF